MKGYFMKNIFPRRFRSGVVALSAAILAAVGAIFGALMMLLNFDAGIDYFKSGALTVIFVIFCVGAILWLMLSALMAKTEGVEFNPCAERPAQGISSVAAAVISLAAGVVLIIAFSKNDKLISLLCAVFALLAGFYCLSLFTSERRLTPGKSTVAALGLGAIIWYIMLVVYMYLDVFVTMNAPVKTLLIFALASAMLATLSDIRYLIGRGLPRYALAFHGINLFLGCTATVCTLICSIVSPIGDLHYFVAAFASISSAAASGVRLYSVSRPTSSADQNLCNDNSEEGI